MDKNILSSAQNLNILVDYQDGSIVSRVILKNENANITLFAFSENEELSEHKTPFEAIVYVLEGTANIKVAGQESRVGSGEALLMPANVPHALKAEEKFKMLLIMTK